MFYAIVDRRRHRLTLNNGCLVLEDDDDERLADYAQAVMAAAPWPD